MDTNMVQMSLPNSGKAVPDAVLPGSGATSAAPTTKTEAALPTQKAQSKDQVTYDSKASEEARFENMKRASTLMFKDVYAVRDNKFAIYKDSTGQFVTRFTNLRDGSVSYIPEPDMMQYLESRGQQRRALVKMDV